MRLFRRIVGLLTRPSSEWGVMARETDEIPSIYLRYVCILGAIPAAATLSGILVAGGGALGRLGISTAMSAALTSYTFALALPYAVAIVVEHMAGRFKSDGTTLQAFKLIAYAATPFWLAGVCYFFVGLAPLVLLGGVYSVVLVYFGIAPLLATPVDQRVPFTLVVVIAVVVMQTIFSTTASFLRIPYYGF